ncbi:MAG TPA: hypothetical protein VGA36_09915, partial [Nitriliruptorales bacterium]
ELVVSARNRAAQTASRAFVVSVGGSAPPEATFLEQAFARENQDLTFGLLGLFVAVTGGAIAVSRQRLHKNRLQRELRAVNEVFVRLQDRPAACEAALNERRARIQNLLADGELDENQFHVLDRRLEELHRQIRVGTLDRRFQFLPHGMVLTLKDMLADGKITAWEHEHLVEALKRDTLMTDDQKRKLRDLIDEWYGRDVGGPG